MTPTLPGTNMSMWKMAPLETISLYKPGVNSTAMLVPRRLQKPYKTPSAFVAPGWIASLRIGRLWHTTGH